MIVAKAVRATCIPVNIRERQHGSASCAQIWLFSDIATSLETLFQFFFFRKKGINFLIGKVMSSSFNSVIPVPYCRL